MTTYWPALLGGGAIGLSATLLMLLNGRVAGVSGILSGLWRTGTPRLANLAFVTGLVLGPLLYRVAFGRLPEAHVEASLPVLVLAGLLVGYGTRLGSGCTSGHGVVGLARLSPRSIAAVAVFLLTAVATVAVMRLTGAS
ncbi:YeeE/YedE family protein [Methylopila capsulata]|nr:YeeE/YedE family protein [Methylopila capsulata]